MSLPKITVKDLLDAGVHFGHKASRWNPKMEPYIYGVKDNIHIIDLQQTVPLLEIALKKIYETVKNNGKVLFVGSKVQASELIAQYAEKCGQFYVNNRWLGGMLTNWPTISKSIKKIDEIEAILQDKEIAANYTKKEILNFERQREKLLKSLGGIRKIGGRPDLIIIIDTNKEHLAINEATKLKIPVVAIIDSNSNPNYVNYPVPGNDDAIRSIKLYCHLFAEAALLGIQDAMEDAGADLDAGEANLGELDPAAKDLTEVKKIKKTERVAKIIQPKNSQAPSSKSIGKAVSKAGDKNSDAAEQRAEKSPAEITAKSDTTKATTDK